MCVTNVSEIGCWWESSNPVYGVSKNPYDILRTPGGSSGGEAALQTAAGIPLSLGNHLIGMILSTNYNVLRYWENKYIITSQTFVFSRV